MVILNIYKLNFSKQRVECKIKLADPLIFLGLALTVISPLTGPAAGPVGIIGLGLSLVTARSSQDFSAILLDQIIIKMAILSKSLSYSFEGVSKLNQVGDAVKNKCTDTGVSSC